MKTLLSIITLSLAGFCAAAQPADRPAPVAPPPPHAPPPPAVEDVILERVSGGEPPGFFEEYVEPHLTRAVRMIDGLPRPGGGGRALVVPAAMPDAEQLREAEEDLNVMARVLEKAMGTRGGEGQSRRAMGIDLFTLGGGNSGPRQMYLEGYGAVFLLRVTFPLVAPETKEVEPPPQKTEKSRGAWDEARADLYGDRQGSGAKRSTRGAEPYDESRVTELKETLIGALENATHMRHLKPEEFVTVLVSGGGGGREAVERRVTGLRRSSAGATGAGEGARPPEAITSRRVDLVRSTSAPGETTMILRVKKSDVDAFAANKLTKDEFAKAVSVLTY
ncbi:MAG TPA: hypothetical protein VNO52_01015 [Methylomirabilota bacterium]|nr:hypothetical protein [Methylomirabilota bacterium]